MSSVYKLKADKQSMSYITNLFIRQNDANHQLTVCEKERSSFHIPPLASWAYQIDDDSSPSFSSSGGA